MHIMTATGWKALAPSTFVAAPPTTPEPYKGQFPSRDVCTYINGLKEEMKYFDDGIRLVYGKPDISVDTDNAVPIHPIRNWR